MGALGTSDVFLFEHFRLDRRGLFRREEGGGFVPLKIGSRAEDILRVLVERAGELVSKDEIITRVWPRTIVEESNLTVQISVLRRCLDEQSAEGSYIQTVPGRGYRLVSKVDRVEPDVPRSSPSASQRLSIVVLPFANLSDDPDQQYFADGVTEDLTADLSRIPDSFVISRHTAFTYRNRSIGTKQIGHELGVRYVVEGSVRRSGDHVRVAAQLVDAARDTHLWAERYDRSRADLFELQDEIVTAIAGAIEPELLKFERGRIAALPQQSDDAYELYQRGMFHHYRQNKADNLKAQAYFRRALVSEPHSSQATAALSIALTIAAYLSWADNSERNYEEAFELGERAVALDARYPNAHFGGRKHREGDSAQPERPETVHLALRTGGRSLSTAALFPSGGDWTAILGAQPQLHHRIDVCCGRARPAREERRSADCPGRVARARSETRRGPHHSATALQRSSRHRSPTRRLAQGGLRIDCRIACLAPGQAGTAASSKAAAISARV